MIYKRLKQGTGNKTDIIYSILLQLKDFRVGQ